MIVTYDSSGIILLLHQRTPCHVPSTQHCGLRMEGLEHLLITWLSRNKEIDSIEHFNEKVLAKQEKDNLQILGVDR